VRPCTIFFALLAGRIACGGSPFSLWQG